MGYTHYWNHTGFTSEEWAELCSIFKNNILPHAEDIGIQIVYESDVLDFPRVDSEVIRFNGVGEKGHETFLLTRLSNDFGFCKTVGKAYDDVVVAVLIAAKMVNDDCFNWSSDGDNEKGAFDRGERLLLGSA